MQHFDKLTQALSDGNSLVLLQDKDAARYAAKLAKPDAKRQPLPVVVWQRDVGFVENDALSEPPADSSDWPAAIKFAAAHEPGALFCFDVGDFSELVSVKAALKSLAAVKVQLADSNNFIVVISSTPLAPEFGNVATCLETASREQKHEAEEDDSHDWRDLQDLARFDTPAWEARLEQLQPSDVEELVAQNAHAPVIDRMNRLRKALRGRFESREKIIDALCCAAVAQIPTVLIGPPGTAKSALVRSFCEALGLTSRQRSGSGLAYFEYMLTRFTTPEEIFGPWHLKDLIENQIYRRVTTGHLPEARIAFLDEIFKASGAILNTLLTLLNEKIFYNGGRAIPSPLIMAFAASNELPMDENLRALVDRFPLRILCPRVDHERRPAMMQRAWEQGFDRQFSSAGVAIGQLACANDLRLLHQVIRVVYGGRKPFAGGEFQAEFLNLFHRFEDLVSDRTAPQLLSFARAHALLLSRQDGPGRGQRDTISRAALEVYRYISCDEQHQRNCDAMFRQAETRL